MKLNAAAEMYPVTWPEFGGLHPFVPVSHAEGYAEMCARLERYLA
jgi:glycine dehydrogenase